MQTTLAPGQPETELPAPPPAAKPFNSDPKSTSILGLFFVVLAALAIRAPGLPLPLDRDEGGFAYIAAAWSRGELPYRDVFDSKPPFVFAAYRAALGLFGERPESVHLFLTLLGILQLLIFWHLAKQWMAERHALIATLFFALLSAEPMYGVGTAMNAGAIALLPVLAAATCLSAAPFWAGVLMGAAILTRQTLLLVAGGFLLSLFFAKSNPAQRFKHSASYLLGVTVLPLLTFGYFAAHGIANEFLFQVWTYNLGHTSNISQGGRLLQGLGELRGNLQALAGPEAVLWGLSLAGFFVLLARKQARAIFPAVWLVTSIASVCVSFRFSSHYFVDLAPIVALLAGLAWAALDGESRLRRVSSAAVLCIALGSYAWFNRNFLVGGSPEVASREIYAGNYFVEAMPVARYLAETTTPEDRILIFGSEPQILFAAQRKSATRFIFFYPLTLERATSEGRAQARAWQEDVARDIESDYPDRIVWVNNPLSFLAGESTDPYLLQRAKAWLQSGQYVFDGAVLANPGAPARYFLGAEGASKFDPTLVKQAPYVIYRRVAHE